MRIVQKYGGTSIGDPVDSKSPARMWAVADGIVATARANKQVAVVVSAMGDETDELEKLVRAMNPSASAAALDFVLRTGEDKAVGLMVAAIERHPEVKVIGLSSYQVGFIASDEPGIARLQEITGVERIERALAEEAIVVVPGFQGVTRDGRPVTLGRGGSDLSAEALANALKAEQCELYKDVDGLSPIDPRLLPREIQLRVKRYRSLDYAFAEELAPSGVLMARALMMARAHSIRTIVKRAPSIGPTDGGTTITWTSSATELEPAVPDITAINARRKLVLVELPRVLDQPGQAARIFQAVQGLHLGGSIQARGHGGLATIALLFASEDVKTAVEQLRGVHTGQINQTPNCARLSVFNSRANSGGDLEPRVTGALASAQVNIGMISGAYEKRMVVVVEEEALEQAALALAQEFDLLEPTA